MRDLFKLNEAYIGADGLKKQRIVEGLNEKGYDLNDQVALLINVIIDILDENADSKHIREFREFVAERQETKAKARE